MPRKPTKRLHDIEVESIAPVDHGANLSPRFLAVKRAAGVDEKLETVYRAGTDTPEAPTMDPVHEALMAYANGVEDAELKGQLMAAIAKLYPEEMPVAKRDAGTEALLKRQAEEVADLRKRLDESNDREGRREHVAKALRDYPLLGTPDEIGDLVHRVAKRDAGDGTKLEALFKGLQTRIAEVAKLTKALGHSAEVSATTAYGQLEALAKRAVEAKRAPTHAQAMELVMRENPSLVADYRAERES